MRRVQPAIRFLFSRIALGLFAMLALVVCSPVMFAASTTPEWVDSDHVQVREVDGSIAKQPCQQGVLETVEVQGDEGYFAGKKDACVTTVGEAKLAVYLAYVQDNMYLSAVKLPGDSVYHALSEIWNVSLLGPDNTCMFGGYSIGDDVGSIRLVKIDDWTHVLETETVGNTSRYRIREDSMKIVPIGGNSEYHIASMGELLEGRYIFTDVRWQGLVKLDIITGVATVVRNFRMENVDNPWIVSRPSGDGKFLFIHSSATFLVLQINNWCGHRFDAQVPTNSMSECPTVDVTSTVSTLTGPQYSVQ